MIPAFLIVAASLFTSILSGIFGMAGGLVLMGVFAWLMPVTMALALHGMIQFASNMWRVILHRGHVKWRVLGFFAIGAIVAVATFSLVVFNPTKLYVFLGLGLMPVLIWLPERWMRLDASNPVHALTGGFVSTGLSLVSGVSGPVTDLLFVRTELTRHQVVATKAVMQAMGHASKVLVYGGVLLSASGRTSVPLAVTAVAIFASMIGIVIGGRILDRMSDAHFRTGRRWIVTLVGASFLVQAAQIGLS
ncbi:MAG: sulfite exporter TauE/SafE family protein [Pseudomonadota bacterium]